MKPIASTVTGDSPLALSPQPRPSMKPAATATMSGRVRVPLARRQEVGLSALTLQRSAQRHARDVIHNLHAEHRCRFEETFSSRRPASRRTSPTHRIASATSPRPPCSGIRSSFLSPMLSRSALNSNASPHHLSTHPRTGPPPPRWQCWPRSGSSSSRPAPAR